MVREIPLHIDVAQLPCLTLQLDQGPIGVGAAHFVEHLGGDEAMCINFCWDLKCHRVIRDCKLTETHAAKGVYHSAKINSTYLWTINYRPFQSGGYEHTKREGLESFQLYYDHNSPEFKDICPWYAEAHGQVYDGSEDMRLWLWARFTTMPSFREKGPHGKMGNWFSWCYLCEFHLSEMPGCLLVLNFITGNTEIEGAPEEYDNQLRAMRLATGGGLKLAAKCCTYLNFFRSKCWFTILKATWSAYTHHVENVKTPEEGLQELIRETSNHNWSRVGELREQIRLCFEDRAQLDWTGFKRNVKENEIQYHDARVAEYVDGCLTLHGFRAWSMAYGAMKPPECYAAVLQVDTPLAQEKMTLMKSDWQRIQWLQLAALNDPDLEEVLREIPWIKKACIRLMYMLFERSGWKSNDPSGNSYLNALLVKPPNNKIVEDIHLYIKELSRNNRSMKTSKRSRWGAAIQSGRLEHRGIPHAKVTQNFFRAHFGAPRFKKMPKDFFMAKKTKLPKHFSRICEERTWVSHKPENMKLEIAVWVWLKTWTEMPAPRPSVKTCWWSKALVKNSLVAHIPSRQVYMNLHATAYGSMARSVVRLDDPRCGDVADRTNLFRIDKDRIGIVHIVDPSDWFAIPSRPLSPGHLHRRFPGVSEHGVVWEQIAPSMSLLKYSFSARNTFTVDELKDMCIHFELAATGLLSKQTNT